MHIALKIALILPALLFAVMGFGWAADPTAAAANMGMPLLEGAGRSTQIGDLGAFFTACSAMIIIGVITQHRTWFYCAALLLLLTAVFRTLAWGVHGASFETASIAIEVVVGALLLFAATKTSS